MPRVSKPTEAATIDKTRVYALQKLEATLQDPKKAKNFEVLTYNHLISQSTKKCIPKNWKDVKFRRLYLEKLRSVLFNLEKFPHLKTKKASETFAMHPYDINQQTWKPIQEKVDKAREKLIKELPKEEDSQLDGLYKCPECKSMKTSFYTMQVRGADEPMTEFITCLCCGHNWSNNGGK